jgi:acyl-CoA reductase-like NAD-dependent aldehyde dehydrogenase
VRCVPFRGVEMMSGFEAVDVAVRDLREALPGWLETPLAEKIHLLESARHRLGDEAEGMVEAACAAQGTAPDGPWIGHQWSALWPFLQHLRAFEEVLGRIAAGKPPLPDSAVHTLANGQVAVDAFPITGAEKTLFSSWGYHAQVWMRPGVTAQQVQADAARAYRGDGFENPGVALALGAGNFASLPVVDVVYLLYAEGCVVALKMNPVNAYLRPFFERIFVDFVDRGWLRFVDGGPEVGHYLAHHPDVDRLHMTGSAGTYNALVWGAGEQGERNRAAGAPLLDKPFTCELGGVSPMIVVPGNWSPADVRRQADKIVGSKLFNCGHICAAPQILILPQDWPQADELLEQVRELMRTLPPNAPYYPGTDEKVARALAGQPGAEPLQGGDRRVLVTGLDPAENVSLFTDEVFADVLGVVRLPAATVEEYLAAATEFANERLSGGLAATMLVHPATIKAHPDAVDRAVADLRCGAVGVNEYAVMVDVGYTTWGGYPGATPADVGSGIGVVGNAFLLQDPQKTVFTAAFHPLVKPVTAATHRTHATLLRKVVHFGATDHVRDLPGVFLAAMRG